jgi:hypothetical protein
MVITSPLLSYVIPDILIYEYLDATLQYMYCNACMNGNYSDPRQHIQKSEKGSHVFIYHPGGLPKEFVKQETI